MRLVVENAFVLFVGLVFAALGLFILVDYFRFQGPAAQTTGKVLRYETVQKRVQGKRLKVSYRPVFEYEVHGRRYEVRSHTSFNREPFALNEQVIVLYDPASEASGRLAHSHSPLLGWFFLAMALPALYLGLNLGVG